MTLMQKVSQSLQLPESFLENLARTASFRYKRFAIPKRNGGQREVYHPAKELKVVQRWLLDNEIASWPIHGAATAYRVGHGIRDNAERHRESRFLLRMDITSFFPSIGLNDVSSFLDRIGGPTAGWEGGDKRFFTKIVTRKGALCIGAPTSPALSNAMCASLDAQLDFLCRTSNVAYSRYADDLFFSCSVAGVLRALEPRFAEIVEGLDIPSNLRINRSKTRHSSMRGRRVVTGVVLTSDHGLSVGHALKRQLRNLVHRREKLPALERARLAGLLAHVRSIEPDFINRLVSSLGPEAVLDALKIPPQP